MEVHAWYCFLLQNAPIQPLEHVASTQFNVSSLEQFEKESMEQTL